MKNSEKSITITPRLPVDQVSEQLPEPLLGFIEQKERIVQIIIPVSGTWAGFILGLGLSGTLYYTLKEDGQTWWEPMPISTHKFTPIVNEVIPTGELEEKTTL